MPYDFNDTVKTIKNRSSMLESYLGNGKGLDTQSHKFRDLRERFLESPPVVQKLIIIENHNPLRLIFRPKDFKSKSATDNKKKTPEAEIKDKIHDRPASDPYPSKYAELIKEQYFPGLNRTIYYCTEHPDEWKIDLKGLEVAISYHSIMRR